MAEMKHMANKQMERHMNKGHEEMEKKPMEHEGGSHESFHVFKHAGGVHSVHHHAGGVEHADHASHEDAMEHGKMAMGHGEPDGDEAPMQPAMAEGGDEGWGD